MIWDILIAVGLVIVQAALAYLGFRVTLTPPSEGHKRRYKIAFAFLAFVGVVLVVLATVRTSKIQQSVDDELRGIKSGVDRLLLGTNQPTVPARVLTEAEQQAVIEAISPFAGSSAKVSIGYASNLVRPYKFAQQWLLVFKQAGWKTGDTVLAQIYQPPLSGVRIVVSSGNTAGAGVIQHAFKLVGIDAGGIIDPNQPSNEIHIEFGSEE